VEHGPRIGRTAGGQAAKATPWPDSASALPPSELSWERIVEIEPRLRAAEREIKAIAHSDSAFPRGEPFCANAIWYGYLDPSFSLKARVRRYTGWHAEKPELRSQAAYRLAYEHLYNLLPESGVYVRVSTYGTCLTITSS
jgi:hypothetical protein